MRAEDINEWLREVSTEKNPVRRWWQQLVRLIQRTFEDGGVPEGVTLETMVFLLKGRGDYWEIGIVEVAWKVFAAVLNIRLKRSVILYDALHGFRVGRVWGHRL